MAGGFLCSVVRTLPAVGAGVEEIVQGNSDNFRSFQDNLLYLPQRLEKNPAVRVGKVDCEEERILCSKYGVTSYPSIRMYPLHSRGHSRYVKYQQYHRDANSLHQWVTSNLPSYVESLTPHLMEHSVLQGSRPWLVLFYTPWCGHCTTFSPHYEEVAVTLRSRLGVGKVNCEKYRQVCERAAVTGYPTVRLYRQHHTSHDIEERSPATIIHQLELLLREDTEPQPQPVTEDLDMREVPLGDNTEDGEDRELVDDERNSDFIYFYDDDNEFPHDEL